MTLVGERMGSRENKEKEEKFDWCVIGARNGLTGGPYVEAFKNEKSIFTPTHAEFDITAPVDELQRRLEVLKEQGVGVIVNFAAFADVDGCEKDEYRAVAWETNAEAPGKLAKICRDLDIVLVHISTDYVYSGKVWPHNENEKIDPVNSVYARSKAAGEEAVEKFGGKYHIVRVQLPFTSEDFAKKKDIPRLVVDILSQGRTFAGVVDQHITPGFVKDYVRAIRLIAESEEYGLWNISSPTDTTPNQFAHMVVDAARRYGLDLTHSLITEMTFEEFSKSKDRKARRPQHNSFDIGKFVSRFGANVMRPLDVELDEWAMVYVPKLLAAPVQI